MASSTHLAHATQHKLIPHHPQEMQEKQRILRRGDWYVRVIECVNECMSTWFKHWDLSA